jgi:hypothetical protein
MLQECTFPLTIHKVQAQINVVGNEEANKLAKEGNTKTLEDEFPSKPHDSHTSLHTGYAIMMTIHTKGQSRTSIIT